MKNKLITLFFIFFLCTTIGAQELNIYANQKGAALSPSLYGIFFEEILHWSSTERELYGWITFHCFQRAHSMNVPMASARI